MPNSVEIHVGSRIRQCRSLRGMTLQELAEHAGISYQQMQKYETGQNRTSVSRLWKIAETLEVPVSFFFEGLEIEARPTDKSLGDSLTDPEALKLVRAYSTLPDPQRQKFLDLACAFGDSA